MGNVQNAQASDGDDVGGVNEFRRELDQLREEIAELHRSIGMEVRTRRLVVVDEAGEERITTTVDVNYAELSVSWPAAESGLGVTTSITAMEEGSGALTVSVGGNVAAEVGGHVRLYDVGDDWRETYGSVSAYRQGWARRDGEWHEGSGFRFAELDVEQGVSLRDSYTEVVAQAVMQVPFRAVGS